MQDRMHLTASCQLKNTSDVEPSYFHEVIVAASDANEILIVGPGPAKLELIKHVHKHDPKIVERIVGVETVDHPTDPQLLAHAKKYFIKVDHLRGDLAHRS